MTLQLVPTLHYQTFSREAAVEALKREGVVSIALDNAQGECAARFVGGLDAFNETLRNRSGFIAVVSRAAGVAWAVVQLAAFHGRLFGLMPFVVLDKPHAWNKEIDEMGRTCIQFLDHRRCVLTMKSSGRRKSLFAQTNISVRRRLFRR